MARITIEDCLKVMDNAFDICALAGRRAKDLASGAEPLIDSKDKPTVIALREIAEKKITEEELSESIVDKLRLIPDYVEEEIETDETSNDTFRQMYQGGLSKSEMEKPASRKFTARIPKPEIKVDLTEEVAMEEVATEEVAMEEVEIAEVAETESSANENQEEI